jgi:hypothetical protein
MTSLALRLTLSVFHLLQKEHPSLMMLIIVKLKTLLHKKVPEDQHEDIMGLLWWMRVLNEVMNVKETTNHKPPTTSNQ